MTDADAGDLLPPEQGPGRARRWQAVIGLVGLVAVTVAAVTTVDDARGRALPAPWTLAGALVLSIVALAFGAQAWIRLFPRSADRRALASSMYVSQLTKYMPAGGLVQAASQVAMSGQTSGLAPAALRLPVFSLCLVAAAATLATPLAFATSLPAWGRLLAALGLVAPLVLDRRLLTRLLRAVRRVVGRIPDVEVPPQRSILASYAFALANMATSAAVFTLLLTDLTDVDPLLAGAAFCGAWAIGYLAVPLPSGIGMREVILVAVLPGLGTGPLLAASLAQRLLTIAAEAGLAALSRVRLSTARRPSGS